MKWKTTVPKTTHGFAGHITTVALPKVKMNKWLGYIFTSLETGLRLWDDTRSPFSVVPNVTLKPILCDLNGS